MILPGFKIFEEHSVDVINRLSRSFIKVEALIVVMKHSLIRSLSVYYICNNDFIVCYVFIFFPYVDYK